MAVCKICGTPNADGIERCIACGEELTVDYIYGDTVGSQVSVNTKKNKKHNNVSVFKTDSAAVIDPLEEFNAQQNGIAANGYDAGAAMGGIESNALPEQTAPENEKYDTVPVFETDNAAVIDHLEEFNAQQNDIAANGYDAGSNRKKLNYSDVSSGYDSFQEFNDLHAGAAYSGFDNSTQYAAQDNVHSQQDYSDPVFYNGLQNAAPSKQKTADKSGGIKILIVIVAAILGLLAIILVAVLCGAQEDRNEPEEITFVVDDTTEFEEDTSVFIENNKGAPYKEMKIDSEYIGLWAGGLISQGNYSYEITILDVTEDTVIFNFWRDGVCSETMSAKLNKTGMALFKTANGFEGYLEFLGANELSAYFSEAPESILTEESYAFKKIYDDLPDNSFSPVSGLPVNVKQVVHFNTSDKTMSFYNYSGNSSWSVDMEDIPFTYGKGGKTSSISEGDDKSPLGVYDVGFYIGLNRANTDLPFRAVHTDSVWVCDPDSEYYNVFTDESNIDSSVDYEQVYDLYYADGSFNYQLYFEQNGDGLTPGSASYGAGSFLTVCGKNKELKPTYGCIDISGANMERLLSFLDADLNPVVVIE